MTLNTDYFAPISSGWSTVLKLYGYSSTTDTAATIKASGYFNDINGTEARLRKNDILFVEGSDVDDIIKITSATGASPITVASIIDASIIKDDSIANAKINSSAAIAYSKLAALTEGSLLVGNASTVPTALDVSTDAQMLLGNGTTLASVAMSGDATIANTGALTIAAGAVDEAMVAPNALTSTVAANVADANVIAGLPVLYRINTAGGATANTDVVLTYKTRIIDAWVVNNAAGTGSDTITVVNGTTAISDAIDISGGDKTLARMGEIDDAQHEIAASGTLRITETDGGGADAPATTVYVLGIRVA